MNTLLTPNTKWTKEQLYAAVQLLTDLALDDVQSEARTDRLRRQVFVLLVNQVLAGLMDDFSLLVARDVDHLPVSVTYTLASDDLSNIFVLPNDVRIDPPFDARELLDFVEERDPFVHYKNGYGHPLTDIRQKLRQRRELTAPQINFVLASIYRQLTEGLNASNFFTQAYSMTIIGNMFLRAVVSDSFDIPGRVNVDAAAVKCDEEVNPPMALELNRLNAVIFYIYDRKMTTWSIGDPPASNAPIDVPQTDAVQLSDVWAYLAPCFPRLLNSVLPKA